MSRVEAAAAVGASKTKSDQWFREAGGVKPCGGRPTGLRLSFAEREEIAILVSQGATDAQIARKLDRHRATIGREVQRVTGTRRSTYRASAAQGRADDEARRPQTPKLSDGDRLRAEVQARLELKHSPEQIARRLREDFPEDPEMWVTHETIYRSIYVQGRGALRRELATCLRTGRAMRKPRRRTAERRGRIPDMVHISERPAEVEDRAVPGHWEGDLITGSQNKSAIGTLVERTAGFVALLHLPERHGAEEVQVAMIEAMRQLPEALRKTVTWDQGREMLNHVQITLATDVKIYFCDPASPWQRPVNENTNGLLRQYFPKGTDLSGYHPDYLAFVANQLNDRPRKRLNWRTPKEVLTAILSDPSDPPDVALTS
jgi:IS30 family transposase